MRRSPATASATIWRYRGSKMCNGRNTFGNRTTLGSGNSGSRSAMMRRALTLMDRLGLLVHVIHQDVLTERVRRREIRLPFTDLGHSPDEAHQIVIPREHEGVDHDPALAAGGHFGARLS